MEPEGSLPHSQDPTTCPYMNQLDPVHTPTSHFLKIHLNIILPSTSGSTKWSLSLRSPHQNPVYASRLPHRSTCPTHLIPNNIGRLYCMSLVSKQRCLVYLQAYIYRVFQEEWTKLRESVPYVKLYRYNPNTYIQSWTVTEIMAREVWKYDSCYTLIDYQVHIKTGRNMWFL